MDYALLTLPGVYYTGFGRRHYRNFWLNDISPVRSCFTFPREPDPNDPDALPPAFYPLPILPLPTDGYGAPWPAYDLSRAFLEHLLRPINYATYAELLATRRYDPVQLATVANHPPITPEQALAELGRPLPIFKANKLSSAPNWCGPMTGFRPPNMWRFGDLPMVGYWASYRIEAMHNKVRQEFDVYLPWFDFAPEVPPALRASGYAVFLDQTDIENIHYMWEAGTNRTVKLEDAFEIAQQFAWSDFIYVDRTDILQANKKRQAGGWPVDHLRMGVPIDTVRTNVVLSPWAYEQLQFYRQQANEARSRPVNGEPRPRGRPPGSRNKLTWPKLKERLMREQHPMLQPNVLQLMQVAGVLPYNWNTTLDFVDPTAGFTRCSPLLPGECQALPRTAINLMHPEVLLWRSLLTRLAGIGRKRMGDKEFDRFYQHHPVALDKHPLQPLFAAELPNGEFWQQATMYIPLPLDALSLLTMPVEFTELCSILPPSCDVSLFNKDDTNVKGYYHDLSKTFVADNGWQVPANRVMGFQFNT